MILVGAWTVGSRTVDTVQGMNKEPRGEHSRSGQALRGIGV